MSLRAGTIHIELDLDNGKFRQRVVDTTGALRRLERDLGTTAKGVKNVEHHFASLGSRFRRLAITVASLKYTFGDFKNIIAAPVGAITKASGEIERMTMLMSGLSKETDELKRKQEGLAGTKFIFDLAKTSPFEVNALSDSFVKFKAAGLDPTNGSLKTLVDSVARFGGSSEHLKRASVAIQQMGGKGVVSMEELRQQLGEAVPSAIRAMATGTGMAMGDLVKQISRGSVEATAALERMFAVLKFENDGAALKMMETWVGQVEKLKTNWTLFLNEVGQSGGFFSGLTGHLEKLNAFLESDVGRQWAYEIGRGMKTALDAVVAFGQMAVKYWDLIKGATEALIALWAGGKLIAGISAAKKIYGTFVTTYLAGAKAMYAEGKKGAAESVATTIAGKRAEILAHAKANAQKIADDSRAAAVQLNANRAKYAALSAEAAAYRAKELAAAKTEVVAVAKYGEYAGKIHAQRQREMRIAYGERAMAAERAAARIKAAEAGVLTTLHTHTARLRQNTQVATAQLGLLARTGVSAGSKLAGAMNLARGAVGLLGGPIGIITTLLSFGATAWLMWGNKADEATGKAKEGLQAVKDGYATLEHAQAMAKRILAVETEIAEKKKLISEAGNNFNMTNTVTAAEAKLAELKKELADLRKNTGEAFKQGTEASLDRSVQNMLRRTDAVLAEYKRSVDKTYHAELEALEAKHKAQNTSEDKAAQERSALMREHSKAYHEKELEQLVGQREYLEKAMKDAAPAAGSDNFKAFERQLDALDARIAQSRESARQASTIGTQTKLISMSGGEGKDGVAGHRPILGFIESMTEKIAGLNAELNKKGDGDAAKLLESLKGDKYTSGKNKATSAELEEAERKIFEYKALKDSLVVNKDADRMLERSSELLDAISVKSEGGSGAIANMRTEIEKLLETTNDVDAVNKFIGALKRLDEYDKLLAQDNADKGHKIALDYKEKAAAIYRSLSNDKRAIMMEEVQLEFEKAQAEIRLRKLGPEAEMEALNALLDWKKARLEQANRDLETPMQKMLRDWEDVTGAMEKATANWLDRGIDGLAEFAKTGKLNFREFTVSILEDLLKIQLRAMAVKMLGGTGGGGATGATGGIGGAIGGFITSLFANGGIMTSAGSMPLKMYSNGGIANSPQLAVFGEGRKPEAYVPLPDGRTIPVTMSGGGGSNVIINIAIDNGGGEKSDAGGDGGEARAFWKGVGDKVKSVVRQELVEQQRPGGVLYRR